MTNRREVLATVVPLLLACGFLPSRARALSFMDPLNVGPSLDEGAVKLGEGVAYAGGPRGKLDVYAPRNPQGAAPVVQFIYGGGWNRGSRGDYAFVGHALASRGFVTVIADYRLVPEVAYPAFLYDAAAATRWIGDNIGAYGGDPAKLFLAGHSAGAYNAVMLGLDPAYFRDVGAEVPVRGIVGLSGPYDFYPFTFEEVRAAFGSAATPEATQPVNVVTPEAPPMFLATGTMDLIVKPGQTGLLAAKLREYGVPVDERYYEGLGHMEVVTAIGPTWRWRAPVLEDMVNFFASLGAQG